jgi:hypothetical protein
MMRWIFTSESTGIFVSRGFMRRTWQPNTCLPCGSLASVKIVISLWILAKRRIVFSRRERQWRAATPAPDKLRRQQLALLVGLTVRLQEAVERSDPRLVFT